MSLVEDLSNLISDLKYEPFDLVLKNKDFDILDDVYRKELILKNVRSIDDKVNFAGQCYDLCLISIKRILERFPHLRVQLWRGSDNHYFSRNGHYFIIIKNSFFKSGNILVDPSFKLVNYENKFNYGKSRLEFDSIKHSKMITTLDAVQRYESYTPIFYDQVSKKLFYLYYNPVRRKFFLLVDNKFISTEEQLKKITNNRKFLLFCSYLNSFNIKTLKGEYRPTFKEIKFK